MKIKEEIFKKGNHHILKLVLYAFFSCAIFSFYNYYRYTDKFFDSNVLYNIETYLNGYLILSLIFYSLLIVFIPKVKEEKELVSFILSNEKSIIKNYFSYIIMNIIYSLIGYLLSSLLISLNYLIFYLIRQDLFIYIIDIRLPSFLISLLLVVISSILMMTISFISNLNIEFKHDNILFVVIGIISLFVFLFINKSSYLYILFAFLTLILVYLIIFNIYSSPLFKVNNKVESIFSRKFINNKITVFFVLSIALSFIVFIVLGDKKEISNSYKSFNKAYYYVETEKDSEIYNYITSNSSIYYTNITFEDTEINKNNLRIIYIDFDKMNEIYNLDYKERLEEIPENPIILSNHYKKLLNIELGDNVIINRKSYKVYGFVDFPLDFYSIASTNSLDDESNLYALKFLSSNDEIYSELKDVLINIDDITQKDKANITSRNIVILVIEILYFSSIFIIYIKESKINNEERSELLYDLYMSSISEKAINSFILKSKFKLFLLCFFPLALEILSLYYFHNSIDNNILDIFSIDLSLEKFLSYSLELFIIFSAFLILDYIIFRKPDFKKDL